ncbi:MULTISPECIES: cache domain-containing sensor histidine kinase [Blautia]|uniref:cache domain-containing sensor histidine kinase n=1 Tax=Blautia TaxID=572511 RepID=UPI000BA40E40|nr:MULTISPECIES: sensor histidine kinase [Blautia]
MSRLKLNRPRTLWIKTILIFLAGGIFICVLFSVLYYRTVKIMTEKTNLLFENTVYQVSERCSQETGQMEDLILGISENQWVKNYLSKLLAGTDNFSMTEVRIVREALRERNLSMAENVYVYTKDYEPVNCFYRNAVFETAELYKTYLEEYREFPQGNILWRYPEGEPGLMEAVSYIHDGDIVYGLLVVQFTQENFETIFTAKNKSRQEKMMLTDGDGRILFTENKELTGKYLKEQKQQQEDHQEDHQVVYPLGSFGWNLCGILESTAVTQELNQIIPILIIVFVCIMLLVGIIAFTIFKSFLRPVKQLLYGMERIQNGELDFTMERKKQDEFGMIIDSFNYMLVRIKELLHTVQRQRNNYYKLEMLALKSKLNPHFLYNAFDMIYWKMVLKNEYEIADVVATLADILRYCVNHKKEFVTVQEDMRYLSSYLSFQRLLLNEKLQYEIRIPDELSECEMPKLLIQPLVENAIKYGMNEQEGQLHVSLRQEGEYLIFEVWDNGKGMPEETCRRLLEDDTGDQGGFGVRLVKAMVKSTYGEECGVSIYSREGWGTKVTVRILRDVPVPEYIR